MGAQPASSGCTECKSGKASTSGAVSCALCEAGKFSKSTASSNCTACDIGSRKYSDAAGSQGCRTCELNEISIGTKCTAIPIDRNLPVAKDISIQRTNTSNFYDLKVSWTVDDDEADVANKFVVSISSSANFDTIITEIQSSLQEVTFISSKDIRQSVLYAKVESIGEDATKGKSAASVISKEWISKDRKSCVESNQYMNCSSLNPKEWQCKPCPLGGSCIGSVTWEEIGPLFGWWKIPPEERQQPKNRGDDDSTTAVNDLVFAECLFPPACLGAANPLLFERYPESKNSTPFDYKQRDTSSCSVSLGFNITSRLCHTCTSGYRRQGSNRCSKCPEAGANWGLILLGGLVIFLVLAFIVIDTISEAGEEQLSASLQKIILNYLQVVTLFGSFPLR